MFSFKKKQSVNKNQTPASVNLQNPKILEVNLIKNEVGVGFDRNKGLFILVMGLVLVGFLVAEVYFGLDWWAKQESTRVEELKNEISKVNQEVTKLKSEVNVALLYKEKSATFSSLLGNHVYWNNFFSWLEKNTLTTVNYDSFSGDLSGAYSLSGKTQTLADISWQVKTLLDDPLTESAEVLQAAVDSPEGKNGPGSVSFSLSLKVKPEVFLNKN